MGDGYIMIIGITGGVGAGKSTVLEYLKERFGARIIEMDAVGKMLMEPGKACYEPVVSLFGEGIILPDGRLDRAAIAAVVFNNAEMLEQLNGIVHPAVRAYADRAVSQAVRDGIGYIVLESAILIEAGYDSVCDEIWYIFADEKTRAQRLRVTRGYSDERIEAVMRSQKQDDYYRSHAGFVIDNSGTLEDMHAQVDKRLAEAKEEER